MKKRIQFAMILSIIAISCTKPQLDVLPVLILQPAAEPGKSFTQWHHKYDESGKYTGTELVIHWHKVTGTDLATYEKLPAEQGYCDSNDVLETVLAPACDSLCTIQ